MNIGVLTFHDTANFGAALQAFATVEWLRQNGHHAFILDYSNPTRRSIYHPATRWRKQLRNGQLPAALLSLAASPLIHRRIQKFNTFYLQHTPRTPQPLPTRDTLAAYALSCDAILAGSDQIWNPRNNGLDHAYLLDFVDDPDRTLSYASSFGAIELPPDQRADYSRHLSRIRFLSVRERAGADLVRQLTGRTVPTVVDPVFLLPAETWQNLATETPTIHSGILDYTSKPGMLETFLRTTHLDRTKPAITRIGTAPRPRDLLAPRISFAGTDGPLQFLARLIKTNLLVTSSFHGTALAILLRRPFVSILSGNPGRDARITELLEDLGMTSRIFSPAMTRQHVETLPPFDLAHERLNERRNQSIKFLRDALKSIPPRIHA
ncbi:MAG TPA: polysaccharide pyruvyl transferase family protein [Kiritimatiellia bacterium]|nr:polysaccharide pyruvyl transferase family protein [Kiritimatiellia bacterium]